MRDRGGSTLDWIIGFQNSELFQYHGFLLLISDEAVVPSATSCRCQQNSGVLEILKNAIPANDWSPCKSSISPISRRMPCLRFHRMPMRGKIRKTKDRDSFTMTKDDIQLLYVRPLGKQQGLASGFCSQP